MKLLIFLALFAPASHAGFWSDFCENHLIADDPYQFETVRAGWLLQEYQRLRIKAAWRKASRRELNMLQIIEAELARREKL